MAENTQLAEKQPTFSDVLTTSLVEVKEALPKDFNITRFVQNAVALSNESEQLAAFAKNHGTAQIKAGLMRGAYLGLDFINKEAYLVPYGSKLNFMIDYRGAKKLAKKYSIRPIKDIFAKIVRAGDEFEETVIGGVESFNFKPIPFNDGAVIGCFAVCVFEDGGMLIETMSLAELEKTRKCSKASGSMAWKDFTTEMYKKTCLHRLCKHIEIDFETINQRQIFDDDVAIEKESVSIDVPDISEDIIEAEIIDEQ